MSIWEMWWLWEHGKSGMSIRTTITATQQTQRLSIPEFQRCQASGWKLIVEPMSRGYEFYKSFWNFRCEPLFLVAQNCLNYADYETLALVSHVGVHEWLWPCVVVRGPAAFFVVMDLIRRTHGTDYPVPWSFAGELISLYNRWQPVNRL